MENHPKRKQIETQIYAYQQVETKKLFDHGVKFIEENTKMILELPEKYDFDMLKEEYQGLNKTAQGVLDDLILIEYSLNLVSDMKNGQVPDLSIMREKISTLRADLKGMSSISDGISRTDTPISYIRDEWIIIGDNFQGEMSPKFIPYNIILSP